MTTEHLQQAWHPHENLRRHFQSMETLVVWKLFGGLDDLLNTAAFVLRTLVSS